MRTTKEAHTTETYKTGSYVVMRHSSKAKRMHCCKVHDTYESAQKEAQRLTSVAIEQYGPGPVAFYILQIKGLAGIVNGKIADGSESK